VKRHLKNGSTTVVYFGTIHLESTKSLVHVVENLGCRAYIGKVNMDRNSPLHYIETTEESLRDTKQFVEYVLARESYKNGLIVPVITPRFVPTCTVELMRGLGDLAKEYNLPIQSHISENRGEVEWVKQLHPDCKSYADVYDTYGLLNNKTIMAHAIYLTDEEKKLFIQKGVGISHCPLSNIALHSGFMCLREMPDLKVGLGTDVSGGYSPSMLTAMRSAIVAATVHYCSGEKCYMKWEEAFHLATMGGAEVIGESSKLGNFEPGKEFDALVVDPEVENSPFDVFDATPLEIFEKFIFLGDDRNIVEIYVKGKKVQ